MTSNKKTGFGIVGTGAIARHHAAAIANMHDATLVAVCSSSKSRAKDAAKFFGVPSYHALADFLALEAIDIVIVCTASGDHLEPAVAAARAGKHVMVEKPLEVTLERADLLINACRDAGVKLAGIFQNRFGHGYKRLKAAVDTGRLGQLIMGNAYIKWYRNEAYYATSQWKGTLKGDGGAALINQGIHTIDLLLDVMGDVISVYGQVKTVMHAIEGEDLGAAMVDFQNGAMGSVIGSTALYPGYPERLEIFGTEGSVVLEGGEIVQWRLRGEAPQAVVVSGDLPGGAADPMAIDYALHRAQLADMVAAVREDREPAVNGEMARKSLALILAIYQSAETKEKVVLL